MNKNSLKLFKTFFILQKFKNVDKKLKEEKTEILC